MGREGADVGQLEGRRLGLRDDEWVWGWMVKKQVACEQLMVCTVERSGWQMSGADGTEARRCKSLLGQPRLSAAGHGRGRRRLRNHLFRPRTTHLRFLPSQHPVVHF